MNNFTKLIIAYLIIVMWHTSLGSGKAWEFFSLWSLITGLPIGISAFAIADKIALVTKKGYLRLED